MSKIIAGKVTNTPTRLKLLFKVILLGFLLLALSVATFFIVLNKQLGQSITLAEPSFLTIKKGSTIHSFSADLVKQGWLDTRFWLRNYGRIFPKSAQLKAGTYKINPATSVRALLAQVVSGKEHQFSITFVEGTRFKDWLQQLAQQPRLNHSLKGKSIAEIAKQLGIDEANPEGWFFPETYAFTAGTKDITLLKRAYNKLKDHLQPLWLDRAENLPYESAYQALIMASIIEKESGYLAEQGLIASVFINRLAKRMRLQTDPTVIYGLGERYHGDITRAHLREKTAYNTYRINGLPPTPIAMVGMPSLKAALNPDHGDYFYFVSQGNGKHTFSRTLREHNVAVKRFLLREKELK